MVTPVRIAALGEYYLLADPNSMSGTLNSNTYDNESAFKGIDVGQIEEGRRTGRFSIVASIPKDDVSSSQKFRDQSCRPRKQSEIPSMAAKSST